MRLVGALGVLCCMAVPAMGLQFDVTAGSIQMKIGPAGVGNPQTVNTGAVGTFDLSFIDQMQDGHLMMSDSVLIDDVDISNTGTLHTILIGVATADITAGSMRFTDFNTIIPGHIEPAGAVVGGSTYLEVTVFVTGQMYTTFATGAWGVSLTGPTGVVNIASSQFIEPSQTIAASVTLGYTWEIGISALAATLTMDFVVSLAGTAHVPEPALGSLVALGLGGAGAWLRRRRS